MSSGMTHSADPRLGPPELVLGLVDQIASAGENWLAGRVNGAAKVVQMHVREEDDVDVVRRDPFRLQPPEKLAGCRKCRPEASVDKHQFIPVSMSRTLSVVV